MHDTLQLHVRGAGASALAPRQADLRAALRLLREFRAAAVPRRGRPRQGLDRSGKMPGDEWQQFANAARLLRLHVGRIPGKKLLFMGQEFGQRPRMEFRRRASTGSCSSDRHASRRAGARARSATAATARRAALHARDCEAGGLPLDRRRRCRPVGLRLAALRRRGRRGRWPSSRTSRRCPARGYRIGLPQPGGWREILNTDAAIYGGSGMGNLGQVTASGDPCMDCRRPPRSCCRRSRRLSRVRRRLTLSAESGSIIRDETKGGTRRDGHLCASPTPNTPLARTRWPTCWPAAAAAA